MASSGIMIISSIVYFAMYAKFSGVMTFKYSYENKITYLLRDIASNFYKSVCFKFAKLTYLFLYIAFLECKTLNYDI